MRLMTMKSATFKTQLFLALVLAVSVLLAPVAFAAVPGINSTGNTPGTFNLTAQDSYLNQPDGNAIYSWGYGCATAPPAASFLPSAPFAFAPTCNTMQVPGPTLIVTEGNLVTINLTNSLPTAAGNTSILFPGFNVVTNCGTSTAANAPQQGLLACEAVPGGSVTYQFYATAPGTHSYYSGTQGDLQVEMGLYGAIIVLPSNPGGGTCDTNNVTNLYGKADYGTQNHIPGFPESDFRLAHAAYDHPKSCYDREYLFQWAEMDARIHKQAEAEVQAKAGCVAGMPGCNLDVQTEPYHPAYFLINGRSMPDLMDPNYASEYPHQPYNGNPHMHPGELTLIRTIGQGRWQHPFHEHANHVRILARDGNLILSPTHPTTSLAGTLMFNTDTTPGEAFDGIFYFSGRGLNWDAYGHHPAGTTNTFSNFPISAISTTPSGCSTTGGVTTCTTTSVSLTVSGALSANVANTTITISGVNPAGYDGSFTAGDVTVNTAGTQSTLNYTVPSLLGAATLSGATVTVNLGSINNAAPSDPLASLPCTPDANGYYTTASIPPAPTSALNYYEWCQDHNKPVQVAPFGDVAQGGPATLPDPNVLTNGQWYGGTPYLGPDASLRGSMAACDTTTNANCTTLLPSNTQANPANERGWAFMWHSHNEREITTNNVFPGGMLMMMLVDSREFAIDESL
jgi:FtsP/CotA-like multicopper oxidase with cupredoxin domain